MNERIHARAWTSAGSPTLKALTAESYETIQECLINEGTQAQFEAFDDKRTIVTNPKQQVIKIAACKAFLNALVKEK